eukprot:UN01140
MRYSTTKVNFCLTLYCFGKYVQPRTFWEIHKRHPMICYTFTIGWLLLSLPFRCLSNFIPLSLLYFLGP